MLDDGRGASLAAFDVGYESVSQFTREYGRMFGASPRRDADASRAVACVEGGKDRNVERDPLLVASDRPLTAGCVVDPQSTMT